ncbi:MAG: DUF2250 domain-containing protein [Thermaerobacter sp.]|nr:DUF2250 domain-containing protein [Thermaerobacter sp.]MDA8146368.1 DUF2250 domain-containing protein [Thermaerobacter sp.]
MSRPLDGLDLRVLSYLRALGPDYAKLLSFRFGTPLGEMRECLERLAAAGLVERVEGRIVRYYHRRLKSTKHRNHTYYAITREGERLLRGIRQVAAPPSEWRRPKR